MRPGERRQLGGLLGELRGTVEELLLAGLTAASASTGERLDVSFKEASRLRLLRLGSTLRMANEEVARCTAGSPQFSARRLSFFLSRAWLLAAAIARALDAGDDAALERLLATPPTQPVERVDAVVLGVGKRVVPGVFAAFDFRLRALRDEASVRPGEAMVWSCVFPMRKGLDLPAEAFLHLPQKQKFKPSLLLEKKAVTLTRCAVSRPAEGATRLTLTDASTVTTGKPLTDWRPLCSWDARQAAQRLAQHRPTPLDLEIELQEEVFLEQWEAGPVSASEEDGNSRLPLTAQRLPLEVRLDRGASGTPLRAMLPKVAAETSRPPLYGTLHYEACRMLFQPLTALRGDGPEYLTISPDKVSQAELVKAMKFT